jgi:hypothetical protein
MILPARQWSIRTAAQSQPLVVTVLGVIAVAVWLAWVNDLQLVYAMKGFSPVAWVYKTMHAGEFALDFPGGIDNYARSAFMHVYPAANALGIAPETLQPIIVAFEIVLFSWAIWTLCRVLRPEAPAIVVVLVVVLAIATPVRNMNVANFPQPYFVGQYYNVADALRIFGLVMVLRHRPLAAAALLAASFTTHPTMGLMGLACAAAMQLVRPRQIVTPRFLAAGGLFALIAGGWLWLQFRTAAVSGGQIPLQDWLALTRAFSYHWYPVDNGLFAARGHFVLLPFVSFLLLLGYYWPRRDRGSDVTTMALAGVLAMLGLSLVGLVISAVVPVPVLIKLALQRSNDLVIMIGLVYVVAGLWRDIEAAPWWRWAVAAPVLVSLCRAKSSLWPSAVPEFPLLWSMALSIVLVSPSWLRVLRRQWESAADWVVAGLAITVSGLGVSYLWTGLATGANPYFLFGGRRALLLLGVFLLLGAGVARWFDKRLLAGLTVAAVVAVTLLGLKEKAHHFASEGDAAVAGGYLQAQVWARDHTPANALFMTDPTIYYGWRDYSRRSSFGNLREWLHTSWIYDSNVERYRDGLRRFNEFNIDLGQYLQAKPPLAAMGLLTSAVKERYYSASDEWRLALAQRYGIGYFVLRRAEMAYTSRLPVAYQNEHFIILAARE